MTNFLPLKNCVLTAAEETSCVVQPVRHCRVCLLQTSGRVVGVASWLVLLQNTFVTKNLGLFYIIKGVCILT